MSNHPVNEPVRQYEPGSSDSASLAAAIEEISVRRDLHLNVGGKWIRGSGDPFSVQAPHNHKLILGQGNKASEKNVSDAVDAATSAWHDWSATSLEERGAIFLRAADLLGTTWRDRLNAATILGQSKSWHQAEIDSACELIDFWRWNVHFAKRLQEDQPISPDGVNNAMEMRPLEGFVVAITPFNFTSIAGNLPTAPAIMGNTVIWKPARTAQLAASLIMEILLEAGLPAGVINMVPGDGVTLSKVALHHPNFAGLHFTGSTETFQHLWKTVSDNLPHYRNYPRLVGETGGKDFVVAHESAEVDALLVGLLRGAFEYQGQKCSAASRAYVPAAMWASIKGRLAEMVNAIPVGDPTDPKVFMGAVIDAAAFATHSQAIDAARSDSSIKIVAGGSYASDVGWFVHPTIFESNDPTHEFMKRELFGPILTVYPYKENWEDLLDLVDSTSPYALTGAVFAQDSDAIYSAAKRLRYAAGNFYVNDKPTGAVVGQQPFGGARASGTNDKAGSALNLLRWASARAIKENLAPPKDWVYPHMGQKPWSLTGPGTRPVI